VTLENGEDYTWNWWRNFAWNEAFTARNSTTFSPCRDWPDSAPLNCSCSSAATRVPAGRARTYSTTRRRSYTKLLGYTRDSPGFQRFINVLSGMNAEDRKTFLQLCMWSYVSQYHLDKSSPTFGDGRRRRLCILRFQSTWSPVLT
jgi:hypothetical protein